MTQLTDKAFIIPIPEGAENIRVSQLIGTPKLFADIPGFLWAKKLPPGTYRFLFTTKTATEEDARKVVKELPGGARWMNYNGDYPVWYHTAKESLNSLLRSKGLDDKNNYALIEKLSIDGTE